MSTDGIPATDRSSTASSGTDDLARDNPVPGLVHPLDLPVPGAGPIRAVSRFYLNYATFSGRASRSEYWWAIAALAVGTGVLTGAGVALGVATGETTLRGEFIPGGGMIPFLVLSGLLTLASIVPGIAVGVRRLHDANFTGLLYLITLVPYVGSFALLVLLALPSKPEGARFDVFRGVYVQSPGADGLHSAAELYPPAANPMGHQSTYVPPSV